MASGMPDLGKQYGPLPLGAWVVVVGAGLGIALYARRQQTPPTIVDDTSGAPGVGVGGSQQWTDVTPVPPGGQGAPKTNEEWAQAAIKWLIAMGYPPNSADSAVRKYITATKLSAQEFTLIGLVLASIGPLPQALPPVTGDDETPVPVPVPTPTRKYPTSWAVTAGHAATGANTFWWISKFIKDRGWRGEWFDLANANPGVGHLPNGGPQNPSVRIPAGTVLTVPIRD